MKVGDAFISSSSLSPPPHPLPPAVVALGRRPVPPSIALREMERERSKKKMEDDPASVIRASRQRRGWESRTSRGREGGGTVTDAVGGEGGQEAEKRDANSGGGAKEADG